MTNVWVGHGPGTKVIEGCGDRRIWLRRPLDALCMTTPYDPKDAPFHVRKTSIEVADEASSGGIVRSHQSDPTDGRDDCVDMLSCKNVNTSPPNLNSKQANSSPELKKCRNLTETEEAQADFTGLIISAENRMEVDARLKLGEARRRDMMLAAPLHSSTSPALSLGSDAETQAIADLIEASCERDQIDPTASSSYVKTYENPRFWEVED